MDVTVTQRVEYAGHNINANEVVNLSLKAPYSELVNTIKLFQLLNCDIGIIVRLPGNKRAMKLGYFRLKSVTVGGDGLSKIKLSGVSSFIEIDNLNRLPSVREYGTGFSIRYTAEIESEEDDE